MILVSVVVPVYNCLDYLERCVLSLKEQTLKEIEIILVDDGSTDGSGALCDSLAKTDDRIVVIHQKNRGVSAARNTGILMAKGKYIGFSDADDYSDLDKFEIQYNCAVKYDADVSVIGLSVINFDSTHEKVFGTEKEYIWDEGDIAPLQFGLDKKVITMAPYCMLISRDLCRSVLFVEGRKMNEDRFFGFMVLVKSRRTCYWDICKYYYVQHKESVRYQRFSESYFDCLYFADEIEKYINKNLPELKETAKRNRCRTYTMILKYLLKDRDAINYFSKERKEITEQIKAYGKTYIRKNFSFIRCIDIFLMCYMPKLYAVLIAMWIGRK